MNTRDKLKALRISMKEKNIGAYLVNSSDRHFNEYEADFNKDRQWLTGFTGSNGLALVTMDGAYLWTDGRYFIQAENELKDSGIELVKLNTPGHPDIYEFINDNLSNQVLGLNPKSTSISFYKNLKNKLSNTSINTKEDLIGKIWKNRPNRDPREAFVHQDKYAGRKAREKISLVQKILKEKNLDMTIISSLDDICWLYNIRGFDIKNNPYLISFAIIEKDSSHIFIHEEKLNEDLKEHFSKYNIGVHPYENFENYLVENTKNKAIYLDPDRSSIDLKNYLQTDDISYGLNISSYLKAVKTKEEIENQKNAYIKDGIALTKFIYWLKNHKDLGQESESSARKVLDKLRSEQEDFVMLSFDTISAYGPNAAMMHYFDGGHGDKLDNKSFYLVDSGGQYLDGTTDITRTIALGPLTQEEKRDFTLVLMGHLDLMSTVFLKGTRGSSLDAIARRPIWKYHLDYKSSTGHGVGYFLGVHEGPHNIGPRPNPYPLEAGMVVSIEPGIYKEGKYGIRTENIVYVKKSGSSNDGDFLGFEPMSLAPIDLDAIIIDMLNQEEKETLNTYHKMVYEKIGPHLSDKEKNWLKEVTREVN